MLAIFCGKDLFFHWDLPVDIQLWVVKGDTGLSGFVVVAVHFIGQKRSFAQTGIAMGKTTGNKKLFLILAAQFYRKMLPKMGGAFANVNHYI